MDITLAVLTSGGDAPGMNAAVSVAARCLLNQYLKKLISNTGFSTMSHSNRPISFSYLLCPLPMNGTLSVEVLLKMSRVGWTIRRASDPPIPRR